MNTRPHETKVKVVKDRYADVWVTIPPVCAREHHSLDMVELDWMTHSDALSDANAVAIMIATEVEWEAVQAQVVA